MSRTRWTLLLMLLCALLVGACGNSDDKSAGADATAATTEAAGGTTVATEASGDTQQVAPPPTSPPTQIPIETPLDKAPPKGKKAVFLQCEVPVCKRFVDGFREATSALGWKSEILAFKNSNPGATLQNAISKKPDFIAITGIPKAAIEPQLKAAAAANIPIISCSTTEDDFVNSAFAMQCGGTLATDADYIGKWMVNNSGGKVNAVSVSIPQFPILNTISDYFKQNLPKLCTGCTWDAIDITIDEMLSGGSTKRVIAYLQTHPKTNYVIFNLVDPATGVPAALKAANLADKVKLVAITDSASVVKEIGDGNILAATMAANEYLSWVMVDGMARLSTGMKLTPEYRKSIYDSPTWVLDDAAKAKELISKSNGSWQGPEGYKDQFKKLWHVNG